MIFLRVLAFGIIGLILPGPNRSLAVAGDTADPEALPAAVELLEKVRRTLPREPLLIKGRLQSGGRLGQLATTHYTEVGLSLGASPSRAVYTLSDAFGTPTERLTVVRHSLPEVQFQYETGQPFTPAPLPDLARTLAGTDLTWNDLSLAFLWWPEGQTLGRDIVKNRECWIVALAAPDGPGNTPAGAEADTPRAVRLRLWIDTALFLLLQMEDYSPTGQPVRRLSVKNLKKIGEQWMIKNMEIRALPSRHRTVIQIDEVQPLSAMSPTNQPLTQTDRVRGPSNSQK